MAELPPSDLFPPAESADEDGVVALGSTVTPEWVLEAYRHGIFPWPTGRWVVWSSPDPRGVLELDALHVSRSLARTLRRGRYQVTFDTAFRAVIQTCAEVHRRREGTWITPAMIRAYSALHDQGWAHSVEVWHDGALAGGMYGIALGSMFAAESMFSLETDASKVGLVSLVDRLRSGGYTLLDIQVLNPHTASLGGSEIPRGEFLERLAEALVRPASFG